MEDRLGDSRGTGGRWSGGKVRTVTGVEIEQEGGGNSTAFSSKVDDSAERGGGAGVVSAAISCSS